MLRAASWELLRFMLAEETLDATAVLSRGNKFMTSVLFGLWNNAHPSPRTTKTPSLAIMLRSPWTINPKARYQNAISTIA